MKIVKSRIGFKRRKHWNASNLMIQFRQWENFSQNLLGNFFKLLIHASLFSAFRMWKCSACKIFAVEKEEMSANR